MERPHLRDVPVSTLPERLRAAGIACPEPLARRLRWLIHGAGILDWDGLELGRERAAMLGSRFAFGPQLRQVAVREADDGTRKFAYELESGDVIEAVFIRNRSNRTLCLSSQAGCAMGCTFCATGELGLRRNMTAGEITEARVRIEAETAERVTDVVFMGMGEPLHNYDAVMDACENLNCADAAPIARKRISVSTSGLVPAIHRFADERRPWRLYLSLHSAIQEVRERIMPIARLHPMGELVEAMRHYQDACAQKWVTLQYVALPGVNMDDAHVDALGRELQGLRYILNVIPWNETGGEFRAPSWAEVKDFTTRLRRLECPVKIRYSAGKQEGMGCGQLSAETIAATPSASGHMLAPPGIFTG
jgi:23S rRNA (adenine2503-C2)-methyltransferase